MVKTNKHETAAKCSFDDVPFDRKMRTTKSSEDDKKFGAVEDSHRCFRAFARYSSAARRSIAEIRDRIQSREFQTSTRTQSTNRQDLTNETS